MITNKIENIEYSNTIEKERKLVSKLKRKFESYKGNPNEKYFNIRDLFMKINSDHYKCDVLKYLSEQGMHANLDLIIKTLSINDDLMRYNALQSLNLSYNNLNFVTKNSTDEFLIKSIENYNGNPSNIFVAYLVGGLNDAKLKKKYFSKYLITDEQRLIATRDFTDEEKIASLIAFENDISKLELIQTIDDENLINVGINMLSSEFKARIINIIKGLKGLNNDINFKTMICLICKTFKDTLSATNGFVIVEPDELENENKLVK